MRLRICDQRYVINRPLTRYCFSGRVDMFHLKRTLQNFEVKYALLYPARLRVEAIGEVLFFDSPTGVTRWFEGNKQRLKFKK